MFEKIDSHCHRPNAGAQLGFLFNLHATDVELGLQVEPELGTGAKEDAKGEGGLRVDGALALDDFNNEVCPGSLIQLNAIVMERNDDLASHPQAILHQGICQQHLVTDSKSPGPRPRCRDARRQHRIRAWILGGRG